jgi:hypothetical protein
MIKIINKSKEEENFSEEDIYLKKNLKPKLIQLAKNKGRVFPWWN